MSATRSILNASRPVFRQPLSSAWRARVNPREGFKSNGGGRRWQSSSTGEAEGAHQSWFGRMWNSPVGFKTVHFWAPIMKWSIVLAGISDFYRPAESLSVTQNLALTTTGIIWTRWCFIIKPKNYLLAAVNFFLACVGVIQVSRIAMYERSKKKALEEAEGTASTSGA